MIRLVLFLIVALILPLMIKAQVTITVDPTTFVLTGNPAQTDLAMHINVTNTSNETTNIYWSRRVTNEPAPWNSWVCDENLCYDTIVNGNPSNKPNVLDPGEVLDLQFHMNPELRAGTGDILMNILDNSGNILASVNGTALISESTAVKETNDLKLTVFPNPTTDFFEVSETPGLRSIELFNIVGNKVRSYETAPNRQYYVGDLSDGIYLVRLVSSSKKVIKTIRLSKR